MSQTNVANDLISFCNIERKRTCRRYDTVETPNV